MPPSLPRPFRSFSRPPQWARVAALLLVVACGAKQPPAPPPGPPIAADPPVSLRGMVEECDGLITSLVAFKTCPNLEPDDGLDLDNWIEQANKDFAAGRKAKLEANAQNAIALACHRASRSIEAATERCKAGPRPKDGWYERGR